MEVYRIVREKYANSLFASGVPNRWNKSGEFVIYTGASRSLSTLELVVHRSAIRPSVTYKMMLIKISEDEELISHPEPSDLPVDWQSMSSYARLQKIGSTWYKSRKSLIMRVPSAIIPQEYNFIINTSHPGFSKFVEISGVEDYFWDQRLLHS